MVIGTIADTIWRQIESAGDAVSETLLEPVIRLGVTGLARSGKTVFIASLVANLRARGRMTGLSAVREGRLDAAFLQPHPDDTVPRFAYEDHIAAMTGPNPSWPDSTRAVSQLRVSLRVRPRGRLSGLQGPRTVHLDIVDYPGEWLLDLGLLEKSYDAWAHETLSRINNRACARDFMERVRTLEPETGYDETLARELARRFAAYLGAARKQGYFDCTPGRFLLPGELDGSPVLTFAPVPFDAPSHQKSLQREMERRFEAYKRKVVRPFFRDHLARIDRQVVLMDVLGALHRGPRAVDDVRRAMAELLGVFKPGRNAFLTRIFAGRRVEKILFAATKADHLHHTQHEHLSAIVQALTRGAKEHARFAGAETGAMAIASLRATTEEIRTHNGQELSCVRGRVPESGAQKDFYPGALPADPSALLSVAQSGAEAWPDQDFGVIAFAPSPLSLRFGNGPPHIRLDRAAQFLLGDRL